MNFQLSNVDKFDIQGISLFLSIIEPEDEVTLIYNFFCNF